MAVTKFCKYIKTCSIYQGKEEVGEMPLELYKNVFCRRGENGWNNCKKYVESIEKEKLLKG